VQAFRETRLPGSAGNGPTIWLDGDAAGVDAASLAKLRDATVSIADLGGAALGMAYPGRHAITLDDDAAGWGWFVDPTPYDDNEFVLPGDQGEQDRMDLLSVVMHELGHLLGYEHDDEGVMAEALEAGTRPTVGHESAVDVTFAADVLSALLTAEEETGWIATSVFAGERRKR
jgi:hypothetical protein